jgi:uncharacterized protein YhdP
VRAAAEARPQEAHVHNLRTTILPGDETLLCLLDAESEQLVHAIYTRAGLAFDRITEAVSVDDVVPFTNHTQLQGEAAMNKPDTPRELPRTRARARLRPMVAAVAVALTALVACSAAFVTTPAFAVYGRGAQYQVELSANDVGSLPGHGLWLWMELNQDGTVDYSGSICVHSGSGGTNHATPVNGDTTWTDTNSRLAIPLQITLHTGVQLHLTVTVPDTLGHYSGPTGEFLAPNVIGGTAQVQVAP